MIQLHAVGTTTAEYTGTCSTAESIDSADQDALSNDSDLPPCIDNYEEPDEEVGISANGEDDNNDDYKENIDDQFPLMFFFDWWKHVQ